MRRLLPAVIAALALVLTPGCTTARESDGPGDGAANLDHVKFLTGASILGREAYIYVAQEKGYFADAGFEVEVQAGKGTSPNLQLLQSGQVDFAAVDITAAMIEFGNNKFRDFTIINAIQQRNLQCIMAHAGSGINTPKDLAGKKIAYLPGGVAKALFPTYAKLAGIDESKIQWVNLPLEQHPQNLAAGTVDAATQFAVGKPGIERVAKGRVITVLPYTDYLTDLYGVGIGVTRKAADDDPDRVRRFNEALLKGLSDAVADPAEAGRIYAQHEKIQPEPVAAAENTLMVPYVKSAAGGTAVGALDPQRVARNIAILQGAGVIPEVFEPEEVISVDLLPK
ncbi:ABC transporter substrate-binding protein [Actinoplanes sp. LDG1-06]|uniref:Thiamine pyrimidine synthase n=1 Tax=Paractinoplanes ovalisporus TaxID=2810368 RepID=A0ABS2AV70_9ACTN|nr:ABC transporter substrate-binding protein [Actinoplanes ovalisporus]MBM2623782.1 ABC transporter substrate-binding protein [Actinoplanes ovalisporus]